MSIREEQRIRRTLMRDGFTHEEADRAIAETRGFALSDAPARRIDWRLWPWALVTSLLVTRLVLVACTALPQAILFGDSLLAGVRNGVTLTLFSEVPAFALLTAAPILLVAGAGLVLSALRGERWRLIAGLVPIGIAGAIAVYFILEYPPPLFSVFGVAAAAVGSLAALGVWFVASRRSRR